MGNKFGKTAGNAMWLSPNKTTPFTLYQYFTRQADSDVEKLLKLFTFDTVGNIRELIKRHMEKPELRLAQKHLAEQIVLLVHGEEGLNAAIKATKVLYEGSVDTLGQLNIKEIQTVLDGASVVSILPESGQSVLDLAMKAGCFTTKRK